MGIEKPEIIKSNDGCTGIEVIVNLENGIDEESWKRITQKCRKYKKDIWLRELEELGAYMNIGWDCKNRTLTDIYNHMPKGKLTLIVVEGVDEKAERMALRVYSALTSENSYSMNFDRFEEI